MSVCVCVCAHVCAHGTWVLLCVCAMETGAQCAKAQHGGNEAPPPIVTGASPSLMWYHTTAQKQGHPLRGGV